MSSDFEWHFGDELPDDETEEEQTEKRTWRRWLPWLLALVLVAGGAYAWWRGRQRTLAQAEAQVRQVARLEFRALAEADSELYLSLQDPADRSWREAQAVYLETAGLPLPLQGLTAPVSTTVESARVVGDRARVEILHTATLPSGEEGSFRAVRFYRYTNDGRWLHTRADPDAGGHPVTLVVSTRTGSRRLGEMRITALEEDARWIDPVASELANVAHRFCDLSWCQQDPSLELNLSANLERAARPDDATLPAPFLLGTPENDAAQEAWGTSLGEFLVDYLVSRQTGPRPEGDHTWGLFEERLRAWLKAELGVSEPLSPDLALVREALDAASWVPSWRLRGVSPDDPKRPIAVAEVDLMLAFLEEECGARAVAALLPALRDANNLAQLLADVGGPGWLTLGDRYLAYVRKQTAESVDELAAFGSYDLVVRCSETVESAQLAEIWGWRLDRSEGVLLSARPADAGLTPISWSPDGTRLLVRRHANSSTVYFLLHAGSGETGPVVIPEHGEPIGLYGLVESGWSPDGDRLAYHVHPDVPGSSGLASRIVDVRTGGEVALDGVFTAWSRRGSRILYAKLPDFEAPSDDQSSDAAIREFFVARRDGTFSRQVGEGYTAAWAPDGRQIATLSAEAALRIYGVTTGGWTTLLDQDGLEEILGFTPTVSSGYGVPPFTLAWSPDGEWIALGASRIGDEGPAEGAIVLAGDDEHRLLRREAGGILDLAWAPHGRWLQALVFGDEFGVSSVVIGREGSVVLEEEGAIVTLLPDDRYLAVSKFTGQGINLQILEMESGKREKIDVPPACFWPAIWNPRSRLQETALDH